MILVIQIRVKMSHVSVYAAGFDADVVDSPDDSEVPGFSPV